MLLQKKVVDVDALFCVCLCTFLTMSHSGCSRLEVRGSGVGQDPPVGFPHSVHPGNCSDLHSCSADVLQYTLTDQHTQTLNTLQRLRLVFQFVFFDSNLMGKLIHCIFLLE